MVALSLEGNSDFFVFLVQGPLWKTAVSAVVVTMATFEESVTPEGADNKSVSGYF